MVNAACVGPAYRRPEVPSPTHWREAAAAGVWPAREWWREFNAPELDNYIVQAQAANLDVAAARARVDEADAQVRVAGAALLPSFELSPEAARSKRISPIAANYVLYNDFVVPINASYELDFWGKNRAARAAARQSAIAARYDGQVVALTMVTSLAQTYFQILGLTQRVAVAERNLDNARRLLEGLQLKRRYGTATQLDVVQQQTLVATATAALAPLQQALSQSVNGLAILLGKAPEDIPALGRTLDTIAVPEVGAGLPSQLLARRPDVQQAEAQLMAAHFDIQNVRAQLFPDFTLTAAGGVESKALSNLFSSQSMIFSLAASVAQPLFEGGRLQGQVQYQRARYRELVAVYQRTAIAAFTDVENALAAVRRTGEEVAQQATATASARTALQLSQQQFRTGTLDLITLLNTQAASFSAEDNLVQAKLAQLQAIVGLYKALGGGWTGNPDSTALTGSGKADSAGARPASADSAALSGSASALSGSASALPRSAADAPP